MSEVVRVVESRIKPTWQNITGVVVSGAGDTLTKSAGTAWGNGGASSVQSLVGDGYVEVTIGDLTSLFMFGLSAADPNANYTTIDFACYPYIAVPNQILVMESGASRGSFGLWAPGDVLRVSVESGAVVYRKNGTLLYTSAVVPAFPLYFDCALNTAGAAMAGCRMANLTGVEASGVAGSVVRI